jgi:hypothetical protein
LLGNIFKIVVKSNCFLDEDLKENPNCGISYFIKENTNNKKRYNRYA